MWITAMGVFTIGFICALGAYSYTRRWGIERSARLQLLWALTYSIGITIIVNTEGYNAQIIALAVLMGVVIVAAPQLGDKRYLRG